MRAKTVNFERGQKPYDALDIGKDRMIRRIINEVYLLFDLPYYWTSARLPVPEKKDIEEWARWMFSDSDEEELLEELEDPEHILIAFEEYWMEKNKQDKSQYRD